MKIKTVFFDIGDTLVTKRNGCRERKNCFAVCRKVTLRKLMM